MKKVLLIVCAVVCSLGVSFAQFKPQPFKWDIKYRGEVHVGGAFSTAMHLPPQEGYFMVSAIKTQLSRPLIETVHGVSLSNYLFVGAGLGFQYYAGECGDDILDWADIKDGKTNWGMLAIPMFVNIKGFFPVSNDLRPFTTLSVGGTVVACSNGTFSEDNTYYEEDYNGDDVLCGNKYDYKIKGGFYCDWGVGVEYKRWSFAIGLQHQRYAQGTTGTYYGYGWDDSSVETDYWKIKTYSNSFYIKVGMNF